MPSSASAPPGREKSAENSNHKRSRFRVSDHWRRTIKKSRFDEAQIIGVLREQEAGGTTDEVCRRHGISQQTFYRWKAKAGGLGVSEA
jgi:DNA invertase Pin-like site-specific DNA recombinase